MPVKGKGGDNLESKYKIFMIKILQCHQENCKTKIVHIF